MKPLSRFAAVALAIIFLAQTFALAQETKPQGRNKSVRSRAIRTKYNAGKVDGVNVIVYLIEGDTLVPVDPGRDFKKGDQIKVQFKSSFDGHVYFVNVPPSGKKAVIYPDGKETDNLIRARQTYVLPQSTTFEFVDDDKGIEVIQVIMSRQPIQLFEDAIRNSNGELGETASSAASELMSMESKRPGIDADNTTNILPEGVRTRSVRLAPPREKGETGTVVAVPDNKLKPGEVAVFEIRLRHV